MSSTQPTSEVAALLRLRERQIDAIRRISMVLFSQSDLESMLRHTLLVAIDVLAADAGSIQMYNANDNTLVFHYVYGPNADKLIGHAVPATEGINGRVFRSGVADLTESVRARQEFNISVDNATGYQTKSLLTVALKRFDGDPIGVMQILNAERSLTAADLEVLEVLCSQAATAIETARLAEAARKAEIVNIIGDVSHDIKNLVTPIVSGVTTLQPMIEETMEQLQAVSDRCPPDQAWGREIITAASPLAQNQGWLLAGALSATDRVIERTKQIADAVKGEDAQPQFQKGDVNQSIQEVVRILRVASDTNGITLQATLEPTLPEVEFDPKLLFNALYNLINNAIPETSAGGAITVTSRFEFADSDVVVIGVKDNGRGMPEHVRDSLFTNNAVSTKAGGTGLGTRIVADVVRHHKGKITVSSVQGQGTCFEIRLPLVQTQHTRRLHAAGS